MFTLIILTFLAGTAWGPQTQMAQLPSARACESARSVAVGGLVKMSKSNMTGGGISVEKDGLDTVLIGSSGREIARVICLNNLNPSKAGKALKLPTNDELRDYSQQQ